MIKVKFHNRTGELLIEVSERQQNRVLIYSIYVGISNKLGLSRALVAVVELSLSMC